MFNLLVRGTGWSPNGRDTLPASRVFGHTDQELIQRFQPDGQLDTSALKALPSLFLEEGKGDQVARIGTVTRARVAGRDISLEYTFDPGIPSMPNRHLFAIAAELDASDFEFMHTHWAVKDVDLFRVLCRNASPRRRQPIVFQLAEHENIDEDLVSVMMPFDAAFDPVHETIRAAVEAFGLECRRVDDIWENPSIIQDVVALIDRSKIVICDCTGRNPNVFYEMGIAHTLGRDVILTTQSDAGMPFDVGHLRYIPYLNNGEGLRLLSERLRRRLRDLAR